MCGKKGEKQLDLWQSNDTRLLYHICACGNVPLQNIFQSLLAWHLTPVWKCILCRLWLKLEVSAGVCRLKALTTSSSLTIITRLTGLCSTLFPNSGKMIHSELPFSAMVYSTALKCQVSSFVQLSAYCPPLKGQFVWECVCRAYSALSLPTTFAILSHV